MNDFSISYRIDFFKEGWEAIDECDRLQIPRQTLLSFYTTYESVDPEFAKLYFPYDKRQIFIHLDSSELQPGNIKISDGFQSLIDGRFTIELPPERFISFVRREKVRSTPWYVKLKKYFLN